MAKVFLGVGHGGTDSGAVGYVVEKEANLQIAKYCKAYLEKAGVDVRMSRTKDENDPLTEEIRECNAYNPNVCVDIHNNAATNASAEGFEVYYFSGGGVSKTLAENIEKQVKAIGQTSRGCKIRLNNDGKTDYYGFIRETKAPAVIVEGAFVTNKADAEDLKSKIGYKKFGEAYAKGILKTLGVAEPKETTSATKKMYYVQVGAYESKANAQAMVTKLKKAGFTAIIK